MRTEVIRSEVSRLVRQAPFRPFVLSLENGEQVVIEHPENIAFDPGCNGSQGSRDSYVISGPVRVYSSFDGVTNVTMRDSGE